MKRCRGEIEDVFLLCRSLLDRLVESSYHVMSVMPDSPNFAQREAKKATRKNKSKQTSATMRRATEVLSTITTIDKEYEQWKIRRRRSDLKKYSREE